MPHFIAAKFPYKFLFIILVLLGIALLFNILTSSSIATKATNNQSPNPLTKPVDSKPAKLAVKATPKITEQLSSTEAAQPKPPMNNCVDLNNDNGNSGNKNDCLTQDDENTDSANTTLACTFNLENHHISEQSKHSLRDYIDELAFSSNSDNQLFYALHGESKPSEERAKLLKAFVSENPDNAFAINHLVQSCIDNKSTALCDEQFISHAKRIDGNNSFFWLKLADMYFKGAQIEQAFQSLAEVAKAPTRNAFVYESITLFKQATSEYQFEHFYDYSTMASSGPIIMNDKHFDILKMCKAKADSITKQEICLQAGLKLKSDHKGGTQELIGLAIIKDILNKQHIEHDIQAEFQTVRTALKESYQPTILNIILQNEALFHHFHQTTQHAHIQYGIDSAVEELKKQILNPDFVMCPNDVNS